MSYGCSAAKKLSGDWYNLQWQTYEVPKGVRHGGMITITEKEYNDLMSIYGNIQE
jgi:hypothetical protein